MQCLYNYTADCKKSIDKQYAVLYNDEVDKTQYIHINTNYTR